MKFRILIALALSLLAAAPPAVVTADSCRPVACWGSSPNVVRVGTTVTFNAGCSYDPDGTIVSYHWDFGDGTTGTGPTATHAYSASAGYNVLLTVTDNEGNIGGYENVVPVLPAGCTGFSCPQ